MNLCEILQLRKYLRINQVTILSLAFGLFNLTSYLPESQVKSPGVFVAGKCKKKQRVINRP